MPQRIDRSRGIRTLMAQVAAPPLEVARNLFTASGILLLVSYDLAVWEGPQPTTGADGIATFEKLFRRYLEDDWPTAPVAAFVEDLLARWPEDSGDSPYSSGISASGPIAHIALNLSRANEGALCSAELAARLGLVRFDPQTGRLRPADGGESARS